MNDKQVDMLMETAQRVFINDLKEKIVEINKFFNLNKEEFTITEIKHLLRFFHSVNGTAATLGLDYISAIGRDWEAKINTVVQNKKHFDKSTIVDAYRAIGSIYQKVAGMGIDCNLEHIDNEYINMHERGKILLIDDDISILKLLENAFTIEGYKVYICEDSSSAMDTIAITRPDIIILDIMMPKLSGHDILKKIKSKPDYSDIHVIFLSAKAEVDDKIQGIKSGADDYITKPFVIGEVITRVEMIMRRSVNYKEKLLKDCLTGAYSRYYFNLRVAEELERYRRNGTMFSVAFIDMDHYKHINDKFGHQAGDYVLKELVSYINGNIRRCDSIYRYGGEEFVILLPDTSKDKAYIVIERLRKDCSNKDIPIGGITLNITFSAGINQVSDKEDSVERLISDADKAMYYAKRTGRNKVVVFGKDLEIQSLKKTLLIVDDENTMLKLLRDRLSNIGYNVITARDGKGAIATAIEFRPDAIVLDLVLPDIDGFEVCKQLKENIETSASKIIMLSKKKQKKSIVRGLNLGADDYVTKPFSMSELEARIMRTLNCEN